MQILKLFKLSLIGVLTLSCVLLTGCGEMSKDEAIKDIREQFEDESAVVNICAYVTQNKFLGKDVSPEQALSYLDSKIERTKSAIKHLKKNYDDYKKIGKDKLVSSYAATTLFHNEVLLGEFKTWKKSIRIRNFVDEMFVSNRKLWYNPKYQFAHVNILALDAKIEDKKDYLIWSINPRTPWSLAYYVYDGDDVFYVSVADCDIAHQNGYTLISPILRIKNMSDHPAGVMTTHFQIKIAGNEYDYEKDSMDYYVVKDRQWGPYAVNSGKFTLNPNEEQFLCRYVFKIPGYFTVDDDIKLEFYSSAIATERNHITIDAIPRYKQDYAVYSALGSLSNQYNIENPAYKNYVPNEFLQDDKEFPIIYANKSGNELFDYKLYLSLPTLQVLEFDFTGRYTFNTVHSCFSTITDEGMIKTYNLRFNFNSKSGVLVDVCDLGEMAMPGKAPLISIEDNPWLKNVANIICDIYKFKNFYKKK